MTKKTTKKEIRAKALKDYIETAGTRMVENGLPVWLVAELAEKHAKEVADAARPTPKQRTELKRQQAKREAWLASVEAGVPPSPPKPPLLLRSAALMGYFGKAVPDRTAKEPDGTYAAFVALDGKLHRLCRVQDEATAARVARVARAAASILYRHTQGDQIGPDDFAATACVSADFPLGLKRRQGRPSASVLPGASENAFEAITSAWVVKKVGALLGKPAHSLPPGDFEKLTYALWDLPSSSRSIDATTKENVMAEARRWHGELVAQYREAGVLTEANHAIIEKAAKGYAGKMLGYTPEDLDAFNKEQEQLWALQPRQKGED
jgi:hypothetical protein